MRPDIHAWLKRREAATIAVERGRLRRYAYPRPYDGKVWGDASFPPYASREGI